MDQHNETPHYRRPGWFTTHVFNAGVAGLTRLGLSVWGSRVLEVKGRKTGTPRRTPVNLLVIDGRQYLVLRPGRRAVGPQRPGQRWPARPRSWAGGGSPRWPTS